MRRVSYTQALAQDAAQTGEAQVALFIIRHPLIADPIRIASERGERLSIEPLEYGFKSTWQTAGGEPFKSVLVFATLPGEDENSPATAELTFAAVDSDVANLLRQFTDPATMDCAVVLASEPNTVLFEARGLELVSTGPNPDGQVTLSFSHFPITQEAWPAWRLTRNEFPGMFK